MRTVYEVEVIENQVIDVSLLENNHDVEVTLDLLASRQPYPEYDGPYRVTPVAFSEIELDTNGKILSDDVVVEEIPYYETSNISGLTIYIG